MSTPIILHNPRCSKSRATLDLIRSRGVEPDIRLYLENPPSAQELERILRLLDIEPRALMRRNDARYAELGLDDPALDRGALIAAMVANPQLVERPIVLANGKAALGRPPEAVLAIL